MTRTQAKLIILVIWIFAVATALPTMVTSQLVKPTEWHEKCDISICMEDWDNLDERSQYSMALMALQYFLPLAVLIFTYSHIAIVIWGKRSVGEPEGTRDQRMARSKKKVTLHFMHFVQRNKAKYFYYCFNNYFNILIFCLFTTLHLVLLPTVGFRKQF